MVRLLYFIPVWILATPIKAVIILLGFVIVPIAVLCRAYYLADENLSKPADGPIYNFTWSIMAPWQNHTDGIANTNYVKFDALWKRILYWTCWRNPANGLRVLPIYSLKIEPKKVHYTGSNRALNTYKNRTPHWFLAWHGVYSGLFIQFYVAPSHMRRLWIGWKILPQDSLGLDSDDYRIEGAAFTTQFKKINI